jgi:hypothetical protein
VLLFVDRGYCHLASADASTLRFEVAAPGDPGPHEVFVARSEYDAAHAPAADGARRANQLLTGPVVDMRTVLTAPSP